MKRLGLFLIVFVLLGGALAVASPRSSAGQDDTDERIAALEARVAALEARVAELEAGSDADPATSSTVTHELSVRFSMGGQSGVDIEVQESGASESTTCSGLGSLGDIDSGTPVVIRDVHNKVIGRSTLGTGSWDPYEQGGSFGSCRFEAASIEIMESAFYTIAIGDHIGVSFSLEEMNAVDWSVYISEFDLVGP